MKAELGQKKKFKKGVKYKSILSGAIIVCTGKGNKKNRFSGVIIIKEGSDHKFGAYSNSWNKSVFKKFKTIK